VQYILTSSITLRTIDLAVDVDRCARNHQDACEASFGPGCRYEGRDSYLRWLAPRVEEFPEGFVLAFDADTCVGHLELEVPYGLTHGYINLFYVTPACRGQGIGRQLHQYAERYFRSWDATQIDLHVSPTNIRAIRFYRRLGYEFAPQGNGAYMTKSSRLWQMTRSLDRPVPTPHS
jgi:ribosomal protein S18 acetylase RimI-like enzyme